MNKVIGYTLFTLLFVGLCAGFVVLGCYIGLTLVESIVCIAVAVLIEVVLTLIIYGICSLIGGQDE